MMSVLVFFTALGLAFRGHRVWNTSLIAGVMIDYCGHTPLHRDVVSWPFPIFGNGGFES